MSRTLAPQLDPEAPAAEIEADTTATFVRTEPIELGSAATSGEATTVAAVGDTIVVVGSLDVTFRTTASASPPPRSPSRRPTAA
jgi:hypothetical protein